MGLPEPWKQIRMNNAEVNLTLEPAVDTPRPLVLTPGEDLRGYLLAHLGRAVLFGMTFTSVLAVLLILLFVILRSFSFLSGYSLVEFLASRDWRPTADSPVIRLAGDHRRVVVRDVRRLWCSRCRWASWRRCSSAICALLAGPKYHQADHRDPGGHPLGGLRILRGPGAGALDAEASGPEHRDQRPERLADAGDHGDADDRQRRGGLDLRHRPGAARGVLRLRRDPGGDA